MNFLYIKIRLAVFKPVDGAGPHDDIMPPHLMIIDPSVFERITPLS
jgi:hypothetical protein